MVEELALILKGMAAGFTISMPVGPVAVICINRTLRKGRVSGFLSGAGGATADALYALIAAFGITIVINFIEANIFGLQIIASLVILFFGIKIFMSNPVKDYRNRGREPDSLLSDYLSVLPLAFANPVSLFVYLGVFSGLSLAYTGSQSARALLMVPGVITGALLWWFTLSGLINRFKNRIKLRTLLWINRIAGSIILAFAFALIIHLFISINK